MQEIAGFPIRFGAPVWLPLLAAPALLIGVWGWQLARRTSERRRLLRARRMVVAPERAESARERLPLFGDLLAWLCLLLALASTTLALARPLAVTSTSRTAGVDLVVLQDGSASMRVRDAGLSSAAGRPADRWQRSMAFLRTLGESLRWEHDRLALALFANIATPQIRLTRDPNTFFFFLDHLEDEPPFRLRDAGTWDTNIERGVYWGLRLIEKDEEMRGPSENAAAFLLVSDGQAWSGEIERSLALARQRRVPLYVVGVGTSAGGVIPEAPRAESEAVAADLSPVYSVLDRESLADIATAGGGRYFELGRENDVDIANAVIAATRARAPASAVIEATRDLYWECLLAAGLLLVLAVMSRLF